MDSRVDPVVRHNYVTLNNSYIHLCQYSIYDSILSHPSTWPAKPSHMHPSEPSRLALPGSNPGYSSRPALGSDVAARQYQQQQQMTPRQRSMIVDEVFMPTKLIVFIPGNPGVLGVYHDFLKKLFHQVTNISFDRSNQPTVLAIGHNNFDHPSHCTFKVEQKVRLEEGDLNFVEREISRSYIRDPHHMELQVLNKLIILKKLLKFSMAECKIIFVGHSIGCYVILKLLQDKVISNAHVGSIFIHPALENLALTPKGQRFDQMFQYNLDTVGKVLAFCMDKLVPRSMKLYLFRYFCSEQFMHEASQICVDSILQLVCSTTYKALVQMAKSELKLVKRINLETMIEPHVDKLRLIYAKDDGWVNENNRLTMRAVYPDLYIEEQDTMHAFIMDPETVTSYSIKVAAMIGNIYDQYFDTRSTTMDNTTSNSSSSSGERTVTSDSSTSSTPLS